MHLKLNEHIYSGKSELSVDNFAAPMSFTCEHEHEQNRLFHLKHIKLITFAKRVE